MSTSFQKLCIRPESGFAYDKNATVEIADGGSFSELLCKVTSKCDTSLLLLTSHKGKIQDFAVKLIGLESPRSAAASMTSAVLSGFKKGLSYLNGNGSSSGQAELQKSDTEQVIELHTLSIFIFILWYSLYLIKIIYIQYCDIFWF